VYRCVYDGPLRLQEDEVDEGKWLPPAEMDRLVEDTGAELTPAVQRIWRRLRENEPGLRIRPCSQ
jgi:isopentenyldiphosphate isomerase